MSGSFASTRKVARHLIKSVQAAQKKRNLIRLERRWRSRSKRSVTEVNETAQRHNPLAVMVINLEKRTDRLADVAAELQRAGLTGWTRIDAAEGTTHYPEIDRYFANSIGCSISHSAALSAFSATTSALGMICEDDLVFLRPWREIQPYIEEFAANPALDVLCLSYRGRGGSVAISPNLKILTGAVGKGCYVVKRHMVRPLQRTNGDGIKLLAQGNRRGKGDVMTFPLQQKKYFFAAPRVPVAQQREGFSDIEGKRLGPR